LKSQQWSNPFLHF